jgi:hypothetical protein
VESFLKDFKKRNIVDFIITSLRLCASCAPLRLKRGIENGEDAHVQEIHHLYAFDVFLPECGVRT